MGTLWSALLGESKGIHHYRKNRSFAVRLYESRSNQKGEYKNIRTSTSRFNTESEGEAYVRRLKEHAQKNGIAFYGGKRNEKGLYIDI